MPAKGVSKNSGLRPDSLDRLKRSAEDGAMSSQKSESANQQAIISNANLSKSMNSYSNEEYSDQTQQYAPVDDSSTPHYDQPIESIEVEEVEMTDPGANHNTEDQPEPLQNNTLDVPTKPDLSSGRASREQSVGSLARGFKCLAVLDPPKQKYKGRSTHSPTPDPEDVIDGWGTLGRNSNFVIVQEGPREAVRFIYKIRRGYTNDRTANISDKELRISEIRDPAVGGKKSYRYTWENVAGIFGAAFQYTGARTSSRNSWSWARVEWQGLREEDMIRCKVTEGYSWIPKSDLRRFFANREACEAKIKEVWDNQEKSYVAWAKKQPGSQNRIRATTPCPLNASLLQLQQRRATSWRATSRLRTPDDRTHYPPGEGDSASPPHQRNKRTGTRSNLASLDEDTESVHSDASSESTNTTTTSDGKIDQDPSKPQGQLPIIEISRAKFVRERRSEDWKDMDPSEREKAEVRAHALYDIYKAKMLQDNEVVIKDLDMPDTTEEEL